MSCKFCKHMNQWYWYYVTPFFCSWIPYILRRSTFKNFFKGLLAMCLTWLYEKLLFKKLHTCRLENVCLKHYEFKANITLILKNLSQDDIFFLGFLFDITTKVLFSTLSPSPSSSKYNHRDERCLCSKSTWDKIYTG